MLQWVIRNFALLVGGVILLPIVLYALLMFAAFGLGFSDIESGNRTAFTWLVAAYILVFGVAIKLSRKSFKLNGSYAYWDFLPLAYFFTIFVLMFSGEF